MPPRRTRAAKRADEHDEVTEEVKVVQPSSSSTANAPKQSEQPSASTSNSPAPSAASKSKSKARAARHQPLLPEQPSASTSQSEAQADSPTAQEETSATVDDSSSSAPNKPSMEERQARLSALRAKMAASTRANRRDILSEQSRSRAIASDLKKPSASRKLAKAESLLEERDLREAGEDVERHRNMSYSLEDSERWDSKLEEKARRKDQGPGDFGDAAERAYQRQVRMLKPNLSTYQKEKEERAALQASSPASGALVRSGKGKGAVGSYTGGVEGDDAIHYGTHKPSDDAIDKVVQHLNHEKQIIQNRSRRRAEDPDAEVNYINDGNKHFNKKLKRYYDKQTQEIRENLERGTAL